MLGNIIMLIKRRISIYIGFILFQYYKTGEISFKKNVSVFYPLLN